MEKNYIVNYELFYDGGGKSSHVKVMTIDDITPENVLSKIRESKNVNGYVTNIDIISVVEQ